MVQEEITLEKSLDKAADVLRSKMDANEYKNYSLGTIFYKYLSDSMLYYVAELLEEKDASLEEAQKIYEENQDDQDLIEEIRDKFNYVIDAKNTYTNILKSVNDHTFQVSQLGDAFNSIESQGKEFEGLFDDYDLYSKRLGSTAQKQNNTISEVLSAIGKLEIVKTPGDTLGNAYEYLIKQFASETGKKAGEFYTPQNVSKLLTRLTLIGKNYAGGMTVYDPAMGSGSLLLNFRKYVEYPERITYFGQEINTSTYNLARMNMILHHVDIINQNLRNSDTLDEDWPTEEITNFDAVVMNPPYSQNWSANAGFKDDPRFSAYGVLPPKSKADYAFLLHGYYHLKHDGVMAIVLPHGILFRGAAEGKIRKKLLESGAIDAVIGLPANLFYNTSIPTTIVVLKKDKHDRKVLFIDASKDFEKIKTQNELREEDVEKILTTYTERKEVDKYSHLASFDEIEENEFNLNIPRYVDTFEPEPEIDIAEVSKELRETNEEIKSGEIELISMLEELTSEDEKVMKGLSDFLSALKGELK